MSWRGDYLAILHQLRRAREARKITQKHMAYVLEIGWATFQRYENGERDVPAAVLFRWADVLGLSIRTDVRQAKEAA